MTLSTLLFSLAYVGLGLIIGFIYGSVHGSRSGRVEGWIQAHVEQFTRARAIRDLLPVPRHRVLVVEGDNVSRRVLTAVLRLYGYVVTDVATPMDGLQLAKSQSPDAIVLGLVPGDNAGLLLDRFRLAAPDAPLVVLTGPELSETSATALGASAHLARPGNLERLLAVLEDHFNCQTRT